MSAAAVALTYVGSSKGVDSMRFPDGKILNGILNIKGIFYTAICNYELQTNGKWLKMKKIHRVNANVESIVKRIKECN